MDWTEVHWKNYLKLDIDENYFRGEEEYNKIQEEYI